MVKVFVPEVSSNASYTIRCKFDAQCAVQVSGVGFPTAEDTQKGIAFVTAYLLLDSEVQFNTAVLFTVRSHRVLRCGSVLPPVGLAACSVCWWHVLGRVILGVLLVCAGCVLCMWSGWCCHRSLASSLPRHLDGHGCQCPIWRCLLLCHACCVYVAPSGVM